MIPHFLSFVYIFMLPYSNKYVDLRNGYVPLSGFIVKDPGSRKVSAERAEVGYLIEMRTEYSPL